MNLNTLHDAFTALEEQADAVPATPPDFTVPVRPSRSGLSRFAAPAVAAAAVVTVAAGVTVWQTSQHHGHGGAAPQPAAHRPAAPPSSASHAARPHKTGYQPPATVADLEGKTVSILNGVATITVDPTRSSECGGVSAKAPSPFPTQPNQDVSMRPVPPLSNSDGGCSGSAMGGTLTSGGHSGGFDLAVFATKPGSKALCDADTTCSVRPYAGGSLAVGSWHDASTPGGVTYQVEFVRHDGAEVVMHLSTLADPKGESHVTASKLPLSTQQLISFVTSSKW